jgi:hypothetical protein
MKKYLVGVGIVLFGSILISLTSGYVMKPLFGEMWTPVISMIYGFVLGMPLGLIAVVVTLSMA